MTQRYSLGTFGLIYCALLCSAAALWGQSGAGSITTYAIPVDGPTVFDAFDNAYIAGDSGPVTPGTAQVAPGGGECLIFGMFGIPSRYVPCTDAHVTKLDASGNLVWGTGIGGPKMDRASAIAMDAAGDIYLAGFTDGSFPVTSSAARRESEKGAGFVVKLSKDGSRVIFATYLPENAGAPSSIAIDAQGNAYIAGTTSMRQGYVIKISPAGSAFEYAKFFPGGLNFSSPTLVTVDTVGNAIIAGNTEAPDLPVTPGAIQADYHGRSDAYVAKLDASGNIVFATYLGGSRTDAVSALRLDAENNVYVAGYTESLDFPTTPGTFRPEPVVPLWNNSPGGFLAKLSSDGRALSYSTYVETRGYLNAGILAMAVTPSGSAYIAATTGASFPVTRSAPQPCFGQQTDLALAQFGPQGTLLNATYYGGQFADRAWAIGLSSDGSLLLISQGGQFREYSRIRFGGESWTAPACLSPDVLHATTRFGRGRVSPGQFVILTGFEIGPEQGVAYQPDAQGNIPRALAGVRVFFNGQAVPVLYAQSRQVNVQAPFDLAPEATASITLEYQGRIFGPITAEISVTEPGIFRRIPDVSAQALAMHLNGTFNGPDNPVPAGSVIALWGMGYGPLAAPCATGGMNPPSAVPLAVPGRFTLGGAPFDQYSILYVGSAPGLPCGVIQVNLKIPPATVPGEVVLSTGDGAVTVYVQ